MPPCGQRLTYNSKRRTALQDVCSSFDQFATVSCSVLLVLSRGATAPCLDSPPNKSLRRGPKALV
eukprot:12959453-Alexandrium_andersonii.AAC.1